MKQHPSGKKQADKVSQYKSPNTGEYVMPQQYIAELIVKRKADKKGETLTYKYWNEDSHWAKEFKGQVAQAAKLLKTYDSKAIIKTLQQLSWCWSLRNKTFMSRLKQEQKKVDREKAKPVKQIETTNTDKFRKVNQKKKGGLLGKIRGLENEN